MMGQHDLTADQQALLISFVEAWRALPPQHKASFRVVQYDGGHDHPLVMLTRPSHYSEQLYLGDLEELIRRGLVSPDYSGSGLSRFRITNEGFHAYELLRSANEETAVNVEETIRSYFAHSEAARRCPEAYRKLRLAEERLWSPGAEEYLREIGSNCREALQAFASCWVRIAQPPDCDPNPEHTINRLKAVIANVADRLGERERGLVDALLEYVAAVNGIVQRQVHGTRDPGSPLTWKDARRCVFHTCLLFYEFDELVGGLYPPAA